MSFSDFGRQVAAALVRPTEATATVAPAPPRASGNADVEAATPRRRRAPSGVGTTTVGGSSSSQGQSNRGSGDRPGGSRSRNRNNSNSTSRPQQPQQVRPIEHVRRQQQKQQRQRHFSTTRREGGIDDLQSGGGTVPSNGSSLGKGRNSANNGASTTTNNKSNSNKSNSKNHVANYHRGVRPRLDHLHCPVTSKLLTQDIISQHSRSVFSNSCSTDDDDDGWSSSRPGGLGDGEGGDGDDNDDDDDCTAAFYNLNRPQQHPDGRPEQQQLLPDAQASRRKGQSQSRFAKLSAEIVQFQRMVAELEGLLGTSATTTPEGMWRSRILMTSAQGSDRDLQLAIKAAAAAATHDDGWAERQQQHHHQHQPQLQASRKKLQRDFGRVHRHLQSMLADHQRRQLAEVSLLTAAPTTMTTELRGAAVPAGGAAAHVDPHDEPHPSTRTMMQGANSNKLQEEKEEFFDRAMRERQEEVRRISQSMRKVQEIYTDLAAMVDGQQEQIEMLEEKTEEAKSNAKAGLEQIQHTMWIMCGQPNDDAAAAAAARQRPSEREGGNGAAPNSGWKACNGAISEIFPADSSLEHPRYCYSRENPNCNRDGPDSCNSHPTTDLPPGSTGHDDRPRRPRTTADPSSFEWRMAQELESLKADVQQSAHGVYRLGHALVEDLVEQVHTAARSSPHARRLTCTPMAEDFSFDDQPVVDDHDEDFYGDEMKE